MKSDWERIQGVLRGERRELEALVEEHLAPAYAMAFALTGSVAESEETVQEAFLRALGGLSGFRRGGRFGAWLAGIIRRVVLDRRRERAREDRAIRVWEERRSLREAGERPEEVLERREALDFLARAIERLPEDLRVPLLLYYAEGLSAEKVGERLSLAPATVRKRLQRAREAIGHEAMMKFGGAAALLGPPAGLGPRVLSALPEAPPAVEADTVPAAAASAASASGLRLALLAVSLLAAIGAAAMLVRRPADAPARDGRDGVATAGLPRGLEEPPGAATRPRSAGVLPPSPPGERIDIRGRVVDAETDRPVSGARVLVLDRSWPAGELLATETDGAGEFRLESPLEPAATQLFLAAEKDGYAAVGWRVNTREELRVPLALHPASPVEGIVLGRGGEPVWEGAVACLHAITETSEEYTGEFGEHFAARIGPGGRFRAWAHGHRAAFLAVVPGHVPGFSSPVEVDGLGGSPVVIHVEPGRTLVGSVLDGTGRPVAGARVAAGFVPRGADRRLRRSLSAGSAETDAAGWFRLDGLPEEVSLEVSHPELEGRRIPLVRVVPEGVSIELAAARWLTFRIDGAGGERAASVTGELWVEGSGRTGRTALRASAGHVRSAPFDATRTRGTLRIAGYLPAEIEWPPGAGEHDLGAISLDPGVSLEVRVVDDRGRPVEDAGVRHRGGELARPGAPGAWRLDGLEPGAYRLEVDAPAFLARTVDLEVREDTAATIAVEWGAAVAARVIDAGGEPVSGAFVGVHDLAAERDLDLLLRKRREAARSGRSDGAGMVRIAGIPPDTPLRAVVRRPGLAPGIVDLDPLERGEDRDVGTVVLERGATVRGRVRSEKGDPVPWAAVTAEGEGDGAAWTTSGGTAQCDARGRFEICGLLPGVHALSASALDRAQPAAVAVEVAGGGTQAVEIVLSTAITHEGTIVYEDGTPLEGGWIYVRCPEDLERWSGDPESIENGGRFKLRGLPDGGPIGVKVRYGGMEESLEVPSARELPERIAVHRGATLSLDVALEGLEELPHAIRASLEYEGLERPREVSFWRDSAFTVPDLLPGTATVRLRAHGARIFPPEPRVVVLSAGAPAMLPVRLEAVTPERLAVLVTDRSGRPVPDARLRVDGNEAARTGPDGAASLEWIGDAPATVLVDAPGHAMERVRHPVAAASGGRLSVALAGESVVVVRVIDADGALVDGGHGGITLGEHVDLGGGISRGGAIRDGMVRFDGLPAGSYEIRLGPEGHCWGVLETEVGAAEVRELTFRVPRPFEVRGRVLHNGRPVEGGWVAFRGHRSSPQFPIDSLGRYAATLFSPGDYTVSFFGRDERGKLDQMIDVRVEGAAALDIHVRTVVVSGRVIGPDREPVSGVSVGLSGPESHQTHTGDDGAFLLPRVKPGEYRWQVVRWAGKEAEWLGRGKLRLEEDTATTLEVDGRR